MPVRRPPLHRHDNCAEILHVLEGAVAVSTGEGEPLPLAPGETHVFSAYTPHSVRNTGDTDAVLMLAFSSGNRHYKPLE